MANILKVPNHCYYISQGDGAEPPCGWRSVRPMHSRAKRRAVATPIPLDAPVMIMTGLFVNWPLPKRIREKVAHALLYKMAIVLGNPVFSRGRRWVGDCREPPGNNSFPQRPVICFRFSGYRSPCTAIFEMALLISRRSSGLSSTASAPMFSSRRSSFRLPGMGTIHGF